MDTLVIGGTISKTNEVTLRKAGASLAYRSIPVTGISS